MSNTMTCEVCGERKATGTPVIDPITEMTWNLCATCKLVWDSLSSVTLPDFDEFDDYSNEQEDSPLW